MINAGNTVKSSGKISARGMSKDQSQVGASSSSKQEGFKTKFDHTRMEKLFNIVNNISKSDQISKVMKSVMEDITEVINCAQGQFFIFDKSFLTKKDRNLYQISSIIVDDRYIEVFNIDETDIQDPSFLTIKDACNPVYTKPH